MVSLNLYSLRERSKIEHENERLVIERNNLTNKLHTTKENILKRTSLQLSSENKSIDLNIPLISPSLSDSTSLASLIGEEHRLVYKFSEINCQVCIDQVFSEINTFIKKVGEEKVLFLANYRNPRDLYTFQRVNEIDQTIYNLGNRRLGLPAEKTTVPLLFIVSPNGKVGYVFLPDKSIPNLTKEYFKMIENKL